MEESWWKVALLHWYHEPQQVEWTKLDHIQTAENCTKQCIASYVNVDSIMIQL